MVIVVGRPELANQSAPGPHDDLRARPSGLVAAIALAAARAGARVELVGAIGDDEDGDALTVGLARAGVGHAALLRDPAASTPRDGTAGRHPRLDAADIELGLRYHREYAVLVLAERLAHDAQQVALDAASFQSAAVIAVVPSGGDPEAELSRAGTVLEAPDDGDAPFAELVGRYAAALDAGADPASAFERARSEAGWERGES